MTCQGQQPPNHANRRGNERCHKGCRGNAPSGHAFVAASLVARTQRMTVSRALPAHGAASQVNNAAVGELALAAPIEFKPNASSVHRPRRVGSA
jgi:hypothetical protein